MLAIAWQPAYLISIPHRHPIFEPPQLDVDDVESHQLQIHHITQNGTVDASRADKRDADRPLAGTRSNRRQEAEEEVVQGQGYVHSGDSGFTPPRCTGTTRSYSLQERNLRQDPRDRMKQADETSDFQSRTRPTTRSSSTSPPPTSSRRMSSPTASSPSPPSSTD